VIFIHHLVEFWGHFQMTCCDKNMLYHNRPWLSNLQISYTSDETVLDIFRALHGWPVTPIGINEDKLTEISYLQINIFLNFRQLKHKSVLFHLQWYKLANAGSQAQFSSLSIVHSISSGPLFRITDGLGFIYFPEFCHIVCQRIIWIWRTEKGLDWKKHRSNL